MGTSDERKPHVALPNFGATDHAGNVGSLKSAQMLHSKVTKHEKTHATILGVSARDISDSEK